LNKNQTASSKLTRNIQVMSSNIQAESTYTVTILIS